MKQIDDEFTINLFDLAFYLWAKKYVVVLMCILGALVGGIYGVFGEPKYVSKAIIAPIAQRSSLSDFVEVLPSNGSGVSLLEARLTSRSVSERVVHLVPSIRQVLYPDAWDSESGEWKDGRGPAYASVAGRLSWKHLEVSANMRKGIVEILVTLPDSAHAKLIADAYLRALKEGIQANISKDLEESRVFLEEQSAQAQDPQVRLRIQSMIARNVEMSLVNNPKDFQVVEYPSSPGGKSAPKFARSVVIGVLMAGFVSAFILFGLLVLKSMANEWQNRKNQQQR